MKVASYQFAVGEDIKKNVNCCIKAINLAVKNRAKLLVLPEAASFSHDIKANEFFKEQLIQASIKTELLIIVGYFEPCDDGRVFNVLLALKNGEIIAKYQKLHLYDAFYEQESLKIKAGDKEPPIIDYLGFKIGLITCYDLRFPEISINLAQRGANLIAIPASWFSGKNKIMHWQTLLKARAIENGVFIVASDNCAVNRCGHSQILNPLGEVMAKAYKKEKIIMANLDLNYLKEIRKILPLLEQKKFQVLFKGY